MNLSKKIVILGHSGFIGKHLEKHLSNSKILSYKVIGHSLPNLDLTNWNSTEKLDSLFDGDTCLILTAAVKRQFGDTLDSFRKNLSIVENVCRLLERKPIKQVIFFSSAAIYGEESENTNIDEETPVNPTSFYGVAKYTSERLLRKTCLDHQIGSLVCLRPPLIYGPGDQGQTYGPSGFCGSAVAGEPITLWGDGTELREFIFIDDLCQIVEKLVNSDIFTELNVVSGLSYSFADIISILKQRFPELKVDNRPRSRTKANNAFNPQRIKSFLPSDFKFTSLEQGISKLIA
jgi:UDP-glucose 4-epimerase